jgi:chitinase
MKSIWNSGIPKERRLLPWSLLLGVVILGGIVAAGVIGPKSLKASRDSAPMKPWFAAYADVAAKPAFAFDQLGPSNSRAAILSFVVSAADDPCTPSWGSVYTLSQANSSL